jgi:signal transduction histidine kinase
VRDNGRGFDAQQAGGGHGLASMRARAERLGGRLEFLSNAAGAALLLRVPLR